MEVLPGERAGVCTASGGSVLTTGEWPLLEALVTELGESSPDTAGALVTSALGHVPLQVSVQ